MTTQKTNSFFDFGADDIEENAPEAPADIARRALYVARHGSLEGYATIDLDTYREDDYTGSEWS